MKDCFGSVPVATALAAEGLEFTESKPVGGTWVLDALWARLDIGPAMRRQ